MTLALREAAKALPPPPGKRSLLLIHDDADNCQQNICIAAQELRGTGITVHVVGLALKPDDAAKMACVPQATGGRFVNAQNADQINAAIEDAVRLASGDPNVPAPASSAASSPMRVPAPTPATPPAGARAAPPRAAAVPKLAANAPPGLYLRALLAQKSEPVALVLNWTVHAEGQPSAVVFSGRAANPYIPVPPGRYVVQARDGGIAASTVAATAEKGPTLVELALNAGMLQVRAQAEKTGAPLSEAIITISGPARARRSPPSRAARVWPPCPRAATSCASSRGWCGPSNR